MQAPASISTQQQTQPAGATSTFGFVMQIPQQLLDDWKGSLSKYSTQTCDTNQQEPVGGQQRNEKTRTRGEELRGGTRRLRRGDLTLSMACSQQRPHLTQSGQHPQRRMARLDSIEFSRT